MNRTIQRVIGLHEHETKDGKLQPSTVLYMTPEMLNHSGGAGLGACCGKCAFFNVPQGECFITAPPACDAQHGVCGLFVGGKSFLEKAATPLQLVPKEAAGYVANEKAVPTYCGKCEYYTGDKKEGTCEKVNGSIAYAGCCNGYEYEANQEAEA